MHHTINIAKNVTDGRITINQDTFIEMIKQKVGSLYSTKIEIEILNINIEVVRVRRGQYVPELVIQVNYRKRMVT